jgi:tRNA(Ile2) C34 agmatinyltransferase TiaS
MNDELCIAENERCPKCDCGAVYIGEKYDFTCGFCGHEWPGEDKEEMRPPVRSVQPGVRLSSANKKLEPGETAGIQR